MMLTNCAPLSIAMMGSSDFSVRILRSLVDVGHNIVCVYMPPSTSTITYKKKNKLTSIKDAAIKLGISVRTPFNLRDPLEQKKFFALKVDLAVVAAYGLILPKEILNAPRLGSINVHTSLLPRWRGAAPIQHAILAGDMKTGVTIMQMNLGLDTGDVLLSGMVPITRKSTFQSLEGELSVLGAELIVLAVEALAHGELISTPQVEKEVTYAKKLKREDGRLNFHLSAMVLERLVRAFNPWPGAFFEYNGIPIKVFAATALDVGQITNFPGTVLDSELKVSCADGIFFPTIVQRPGKKIVNVEDFLRGFPIKPGSILD
ncbi:methionyl-tRNA formyltransferase [Candidatus Endolissoclinum faulkneri L2]|uniref:Methionyl-tRNA formyltransferase n=1 Tax=Candidatus Endolissoclinum faulkneri L2 TaxID=1193729 RepID=K7YG23_9PROT|nr:methionyl-tRNA formyltransferase [Candidatus Endolissoclinum faulkneri]AFX98550.1 methionyl-tRNA formyltransferase [Candidatus Endolissoclinum faulkneri L2]